MHNTWYQQLPGAASTIRSGALKCKTKTFNQTTVTVDRNETPIAATAHTTNRYVQGNYRPIYGNF